MSDDAARAEALRPLWMIATGAAVGAAAALAVTRPGPGWLRITAVALGAGAIAAALRRGRSASALLWFLGGLAAVGGRGLDVAADRMAIATMTANPSATVRVSVVILDGWRPSRWGMRTRVGVLEAAHRERRINLPRRCAMEIRGVVDPGDAADAERAEARRKNLRDHQRDADEPGHNGGKDAAQAQCEHAQPQPDQSRDQSPDPDGDPGREAWLNG